MADVVIAHRDAIVRQAIGAVLEDRCLEQKMVAYARDGERALALCRQYRPGLLFLDAKIAGLPSAEVVSAIQRERLGTKIIALSLHPPTPYLPWLARLGAAGCLVLGEDYEAQVVAAVSAVAKGHRWLSPELTPLLADQCGGLVPYELSLRELEVLTLVGKGMSNAAIAERLSVRKFIVQNHVKAVYGKLDLPDRVQAVLYAIRQGLVDPYEDE